MSAAELKQRLVTALADRYRIERELGQGGMATVYLAEDIKHKRKVAVKVLKPELAAVLGAERFVQEITTTAALQHPHILPLFDSGTADGFLYYVMPFIDGETLRSKLDRETQFGIDEAVRIASQVADALDYAHRQGVVHRDIKPENILLHEGRPMVADFGIALAVSAAAGGRMTETGLSLGTPHYMSPEQATAEKEISGRSDVYSLASVLYEMLAGQPPHLGGSAQQIIMKIIAEQPAAVTTLRKSVPANVAAAVAKALEKLPADRFASAREFVQALGDRQFMTEAVAGMAAGVARHSWRSWLRDTRSWVALLAIGGSATVALMASGGGGTRVAGPETLRFTISGPSDSSVLSLNVRHGLAISEPTIAPDDRHIAFSVNGSAGSALYLRALDSFELIPVPGAGYWPFFSPDGNDLAFFRENEVWAMSIAEGVPARLATLEERGWDVTSAVWDPAGRILVNGARGLWSLPARGGNPTLLVATDSAKLEQFESVSVLADGRILLGIRTRDGERNEVLSPDAAKRTPIVPGFASVSLVDDVLFYQEAGQQRATRFDTRRLEPVGESIALTDYPSPRPGRSIVWKEGGSARPLEPVWVSRGGAVTPVAVPSAFYRWPRVSPDGRRLAVGTPSGASAIAVFAIGRGTGTAMRGVTEPVWSPDGGRIFASLGNRPRGGILQQVADGSRAPDTLLKLETGDAWPTDASRDGRWLAFYGATLGVGTGDQASDLSDLQFLDLSTREVRRVVLRGAQRGGRFSPDGRWVAYQSEEGGSEEVHIRPWPAMDADYVISSGGGSEPTWSPDGKELYFRNGDEMLAVALTFTGSNVERAAPVVLFSGVFSRDQFLDQSYDIGPDGRFLMLRPLRGGSVDLKVALNWIAEVRARLERGR